MVIVWHGLQPGSRILLSSSAFRARRPLQYSVRATTNGGQAATNFDMEWLAKQTLVMAAASAILGPFCDGQHSSQDVLHYAQPIDLELGPVHLETCWWVPLLFSVAGIILGVSHPYLDTLPWATKPRAGTDPSWLWVLVGVALFVVQYGASGALEEPLLGSMLGPVPTIDAALFCTGVAHWWLFDGTRQGLGMALLTAVCGPLIEIGLINVGHLYHYTHPQVFGVPTWIPWVYLCGSAAVGNLGRKVSASLQISNTR